MYDLLHSKIGKEGIEKILADFSCSLNKDVEDFVKKKAYDFERVGLSRTYLVVSNADKQVIGCGI